MLVNPFAFIIAEIFLSYWLVSNLWDRRSGFFGLFLPTVFGLTFATFFFNVPVREIISSPGTIAIVIAAYLALGILWSSLFEWRLHLIEIRDEYIRVKEEFVNDWTNKEPEIFANFPETLKADEDDDISVDPTVRKKYQTKLEVANKFKMKLSMNGLLSNSIDINDMVSDPASLKKAIIPSPLDAKAKICKIITYWPIFAVWTIVNHPVKRVVNFLYSCTRAIYERQTTSVFKDI